MKIDAYTNLDPKKWRVLFLTVLWKSYLISTFI